MEAGGVAQQIMQFVVEMGKIVVHRVQPVI
jgi:hypothetical protein